MKVALGVVAKAIHPTTASPFVSAQTRSLSYGERNRERDRERGRKREREEGREGEARKEIARDRESERARERESERASETREGQRNGGSD